MSDKKEEKEKEIYWLHKLLLWFERTKIKYTTKLPIQNTAEEFEKRIEGIKGKTKFDSSVDKKLLSDIIQGVKLADEIYQFDANPKRIGFQQVMEREFDPPLINGYDWEILSKEKNLVGVKAKQFLAAQCKDCLWTCAENADPTCTIPCLKYCGWKKLKTNIREDRKDAFMMFDKNTETLWISCRGTQNFKDMVTNFGWNIRDYKVKFEDHELTIPNAAHERTVEILKNLIMFMRDEKYDEKENDKIVPKADEFKDGKRFFQRVKRIGFCGHSLGGGNATNLYLLFCNLQKSESFEELNLEKSKEALADLDSKIKALGVTDVLNLPRLLYKKSKYSQYIKDIEYIKKNFTKQIFTNLKTILVTLNAPHILNRKEKFDGPKSETYFKKLAENAHHIVTRFDIVARTMGVHEIPKFPYSKGAIAFSALSKIVNDRLEMKMEDGKLDRDCFIPFGKYYSLIPGFVDQIQNLEKAKLYYIKDPNDLLKEVPPADHLNFKNAIRDHGSDFAVKALETLQEDWKVFLK